MSVTPGNKDSILLSPHTHTHTQHDRKWFNSSYALLFSFPDSLMTGDSIARLGLPFHTSICHTTLYNHIQLILGYYWILGSQQCAVTAIVFLLLEANGSRRTMSFTNEGVVGCQQFRLQMCSHVPANGNWHLARLILGWGTAEGFTVPITTLWVSVFMPFHWVLQS